MGNFGRERPQIGKLIQNGMGCDGAKQQTQPPNYDLAATKVETGTKKFISCVKILRIPTYFLLLLEAGDKRQKYV